MKIALVQDSPLACGDNSDDVKPLTLHGTGIPCRDDTPMNNKKEGRLGKQRPVHLMVQEEFRATKPVVGVWECSDKWKPYEIAEDNKSTHTTEFSIIRSNKFGDSYHRDRCVAWNVKDEDVRGYVFLSLT